MIRPQMCLVMKPVCSLSINMPPLSFVGTCGVHQAPMGGERRMAIDGLLTL